MVGQASPQWPKWLLAASVLALSWIGMMAVHELGHVAGARLTGGEVARVVLHPLSISRTDLAANPYPRVVAWMGPLIGSILPLVVWVAAERLLRPLAASLRFFAGFCLVANGLYLAGGSVAQIGDCGDLLRHGAAIWQFWAFGLVTVPLGFWLWNGQGPHFGFGERAHPVTPCKGADHDLRRGDRLCRRGRGRKPVKGHCGPQVLDEQPCLFARTRTT